jgi:hypothetical protein
MYENKMDISASSRIVEHIRDARLVDQQPDAANTVLRPNMWLNLPSLANIHALLFQYVTRDSWHDQIMKYVVGGACGMSGEEERCTAVFWWETLKEKVTQKA